MSTARVSLPPKVRSGAVASLPVAAARWRLPALSYRSPRPDVFLQSQTKSIYTSLAFAHLHLGALRSRSPSPSWRQRIHVLLQV